MHQIPNLHDQVKEHVGAAAFCEQWAKRTIQPAATHRFSKVKVIGKARRFMARVMGLEQPADRPRSL